MPIRSIANTGHAVISTMRVSLGSILVYGGDKMANQFVNAITPDGFFAGLFFIGFGTALILRGAIAGGMEVVDYKLKEFMRKETTDQER